MSAHELSLGADDPLLSGLAGKSEADNVRHVVVRVAFLNEFRQDERVEAVYHEWRVRFGLQPIALELACTLDKLAQAEGLRHRGELFDDSQALSDAEGCDELDDRANQLFDALIGRLGGIDWEDVGSDAIEFVKSLGLPWPWLAGELLWMFFLEFYGFVTGREFVEEVSVDPVAQVAPPTELQYSSRPDETAREALARLLEEVHEVIKRLAEPIAELPRGRVPANLDAEYEDGVGRYGRWFYRQRIRGESINAIARDAHFDRATVRYGLREAERLLGLTRYTF